jgi:chemotaxis methyl-accepting protein methylase
MDDEQFRQLLSQFGFSWDGYRKVRRGVKKRVTRHMQQTNCRTMQAYFSLLHEDKEARQHFECLMTVSISRFFRDRRLWEVLEKEILPALIQEDNKKVKIWSAGCACGEEVYSLQVVWKRLSGRFQTLPHLEMLATDMNPVYLKKAQDGVYPRSSLREVPEAIRDEYFRPMRKGRSYAVSGRLKEGVVWQEHNLLVDSPWFGFQMVFLRNSLLTYYTEALEIPAFHRVLDSITRSGFLIIGSHEKIPVGNWGLVRTGLHPHIHQKTR